MLADRISKIEEDFLSNNSHFQFEFFAIDIPTDLMYCIEGHACRPSNGYSGYFEAEELPKERIVLHFTVGNLKSDINALTDPNRGRVSTAFVMARNGTLFQLFNAKYWSHHLGRGAKGGNQVGSKASIGIEISNYGPLKRVGNELKTIYDQVYCTLDDTDKYLKLDTDYRGNTYYAAYTPQQYDHLIRLLRYLTAAYEIPREFLPVDRRYEASVENATFKGIVTHVNSRTDKVDIGPAFNWDLVIKGVTMPEYDPFKLEAEGLMEVTRDLMKPEGITSEDLIDQRMPVAKSRDLLAPEIDEEELEMEEPNLVNFYSESDA